MGRSILLMVFAVSATTGTESSIPGQAIVKFAPGVHLLSADGRVRTGFAGLDLLMDRYAVTGARPLVPCADSIVRASGADRVYLLSFRPDAEVNDVVRSFSAAELVEDVWPDEWLPLDSVPDDSLYPQQWHLAHIGAPGAWATAHGDSNVRLAVIGDGVHWSHPDLEANLWINSAEDINHNGRFDTLAPPGGDLDGVDQDGNGYSDDVIGFDFYQYDPDPMASDLDAVGTQGAGSQNAVADNGLGVSAPPWNVRSLALRCGAGGGIYISAAVSAIYYAIQKGVWAFSMPFGSESQSQLLAQACRDAWNAGRIPCAGAAGMGEIPRYPAAYDGVIAVAAHDRTNRKSGFSNWGTWVDICAPGDDIWTTVGQNRYEPISSTGLAAAVVVGVLGWVKSAYPGVGRDSALDIVRGMCDTMPDPLYWQGKLGWGRIRMSVPDSTAIAESRTPNALRYTHHTAVVRSVLCLPEYGLESEASIVLLDACGRRVMTLRAGANDVSGLTPGVYFVVERSRAGRGSWGKGQKVVVAR